MRCYSRNLPVFLKNPLFGNREQFGLVPDETDRDWVEWKERFFDFYDSTQKNGIGKHVNDAGYHVLRDVNLDGKRVAEIGPGNMPHLEFWRGSPDKFTAIDISREFLEITGSKVTCPYEAVYLSSRTQVLPIADNSFDILFSFYSLEHLHPLDDHIAEYYRILKPGGLFVGAIPNEGGLAWGLGRFLTSRRWIRKNTSLNYDKIICWEHPNFADTILNTLDKYFFREKLAMAPISLIPQLDINLLTKFRYRKTN